jgi:DUF4097 and DUF4098 domain-containing protein YvlB
VRGSGNFGDIVIKTASGDTFFEHVGDFEVNSASGDVGVRRAGGSVTINTASGDIELGTVDGPVKANSMSGDVTVGLARNSLTAQTVSGDQEISAITTGEVRLNSVSGDVRVGVVSGVKLWIDASSVSGEMRSELEVGDLPPTDDAEVVQLRAKTVSGDVNIVRAIGQVSA